MGLSRTVSLLPHVSRFLMLTLAAAMALPLSLPSQTPKDLIAQAGYNELQQRERKTFWSYVAERRVSNHVFREQVIETVDGPVRHLLAVDGHPPTSGQIKEEEDQHHELLKNPSATRTIRKQWRYALDYEVRPPSGMSGRVRLKARYSANAVFYLKVRMVARKEGGSKFGWLAFRLGNGSPKRDSNDEWIIYVSGTNGWILLNVLLPYHVAGDFGKDQSLSYQELIEVRLRGSISVSPIQFFP